MKSIIGAEISMSITPASMNAASPFAPEPYDFDDATPLGSPTAVGEPVEAARPIDLTANLQSGIAALEQRFMAFTKTLTRELAAMERQFTSALRSLVGAAKKANAATAGAPNGKEGAAPSGPPRYGGLIRNSAAQHGLDPLLVESVIRQESGFRADAVSPAGALGLMQLMPATAKSLGVADPMDAQQNVDGGTRLLRSLLDRYDGRLDFALAAYNAGPAAVDRYGGVPPYPETRSYVTSIMDDYRASALASS
jgi:soluble lytic murein transglycosylase-like protein